MTVLLEQLQGELDHAQELLDAAARRVQQLGVIQNAAHELDTTLALVRQFAPDLGEKTAALRDALAGLDGVGEGADHGTAAAHTPAAVPAAATPPADVGALPPAADTVSEHAAGSPSGPDTSTETAGGNGADAPGPGAPGGAPDTPGSGPSTGGRPNRTGTQRKRYSPQTRTEVETFLQSSRGATKVEISEALDRDDSLIGAILNDLADDNAVRVAGMRPRQRGTNGRGAQIYELTRPAAAPSAARDERPARVRVLEALKDLEEATLKDLTQKTGLHPTTISPILDGAIDVTVIGKRPGRAGQPAKIFAFKTVADRKAAAAGTRGQGPGGHLSGNTEKRRTQVLECILEGAGQVDELEIAAQLDMPREHVAEATGHLLQEGHVHLQPDGTYIDAREAIAA